MIHTTYHFTVGVGLRYLLGVEIFDDSIYRESDIDPVFLDEQLSSTTRLVPTVAVRLSRAF